MRRLFILLEGSTHLADYICRFVHIKFHVDSFSLRETAYSASGVQERSEDMEFEDIFAGVLFRLNNLEDLRLSHLCDEKPTRCPNYAPQPTPDTALEDLRETFDCRARAKMVFYGMDEQAQCMSTVVTRESYPHLRNFTIDFYSQLPDMEIQTSVLDDAEAVFGGMMKEHFTHLLGYPSIDVQITGEVEFQLNPLDRNSDCHALRKVSVS
ncbi:unnamed protein product [Cyclocybe aegerita]|uniref:Uncharacterized protein n=1 Tax=Cyclocybe aegerita TaxID=1973307 RepID=A0A8S0XQK9_CYCAE|nr:unnamed protein product [Cyclocybe aegerita]